MISISDIRNDATTFDVPVEWAMQRRIIFLKEQMKSEALLITSYAEYEGNPETEALSLILAKQHNEHFLKLAREVRSLALAMRRKSEPEGYITDEMVETARNYPIERVIDFHKGSSKCFAHDDKRPSLSHWKKGNKASCFVCNKRWNPIDVLVERDGMSFHDAVRQLQ